MNDKLKSQLDALSELDAMQPASPRPQQPKPKPAEGKTAKPKAKEPQTHGKDKKETTGRKWNLSIGGKGEGARQVLRVLRGDLLDTTFVRKQVGIIVMVCVYGLIMVFMRYQVEGLQKEKESTMKRIDYLEEHRIAIRQQYQHAVMISTLAEKLEDKGIGTISGPPYEL